jgi:hypothetical protein
VFKRCIEHLHQAAEHRPDRELLLAYVNPWHCESWLERSGYFVRVAEYQVIPRVWSWSLWRHVKGVTAAGSGRWSVVAREA